MNRHFTKKYISSIWKDAHHHQSAKRCKLKVLGYHENDRNGKRLVMLNVEQSESLWWEGKSDAIALEKG